MDVRRATAIAFVIGLAGCSLIRDFGEFETSAAPVGDASVESCGVGPPSRPDDDDDEDIGDVSFALKEVELLQGAGWRNIGFDLDGICTEAPDLMSECAPPGRTEAPEDGDQGRDNVFGESLFPLVNVANPGLQDAARAVQEAGQGAVMVRLNGYNGTANDARVVVTVAGAVFGTTAEIAPQVTFAGDGTPMLPPGGEYPPPPSWSDGDDVFWGRTDNFVGGNQANPLIFDDNAYVANGMLVVRLPSRSDFVFHAGEAGMRMRLTEGVLVGHISEDLTQLQDVTVAGRWAIADILETGESLGICLGSENLRLLTTLLEDAADVRSEAGTGGERVPCNAVSVGIRFQGYRASWGGITGGPELPNPCE
jgi:hypothetical protein